ncbi:MAG: hypothetical protein F9K43_28830, partial [Bauldia sp.]
MAVLAGGGDPGAGRQPLRRALRGSLRLPGARPPAHDRAGVRPDPMSLALSWSGGKDAAWALHLLRQQGEDVAALVTTVIQGQDRNTTHRVRRAVIRQQAALVDLPLLEIELPWPCGDELYSFAVGAALADLKRREGIEAVAFGDLFLADLRRFRERLLEPIGLAAVFPLWGMRTDLLAQRLLRA